MAKYDAKCTHCKCDVVDIKGLNILWKSHSYACYIDEKHSVRFEAIASIEHIKPRSVGGTNHKDNLTLHCMECNHIKNTWFEGNYPNKKPLDNLLGIKLGLEKESSKKTWQTKDYSNGTLFKNVLKDALIKNKVSRLNKKLNELFDKIKAKED